MTALAERLDAALTAAEAEARGLVNALESAFGEHETRARRWAGDRLRLVAETRKAMERHHEHCCGGFDPCPELLAWCRVWGVDVSTAGAVDSRLTGGGDE